MPRRETRVLREMPRVNYYEPEEPALDEYVFCEKCRDYVYEYCAIHGPLLVIPDTKVSYKPNIPAIVPRAALTIPRVFLHLARSIIPGAGIGVFSTLTLPRGVRFGPYRGQCVHSSDSMYCWQIYDGDRRRAHVVDARDARCSNWMRYVNCARHWREQNLVAFQYRGELYYRTIKIIPRFTELLVFYGSEYANLLGVNLAAYNAPLGYAAKFGASVLKKPKPTALKENPHSPDLINPKKNEKVKVDIRENRNNKKIFKTVKPVIENNIVYCPSNEVENTFDKRLNEKTVVKENKLNTHTSNFSEKLSNDNSNFNIQNQTFNEEPLKCVIDDKSVNLKSKLQNQSSKKPYKCDQCQKCFSLRRNLKRHLRTHTGEKPYKCDHCQKCFSQHIHLKLHLRRHSGEKPYKCDHCQKCFNTNGELKLHLRTHTGEKPYKCDHCQKCFSLRRNLKRHLRTHTGEKPYKCDHCQKCFSQHIYLKLHLRTHTGEKPYKCDHCQKCFSQHINLKLHIRTHTGEKPYKCDHCQKCFTTNKDLKRHLRTHTGEKPYKCDHCQKCFSHYMTLKHHLRTHMGEKPYKCDHCQKCFTTNEDLKRHLRTHTGEKPYKCDQCQKCFSRKSNLKSHLRTHKMKYKL